ncbi:MAG: PP2C family protein-serine/threonine phosphatase [Candidatus Kapabacteria bacterium]|nr:PP2C family protein-serine/threonine phosphatase [Ignavibacteriota bacterium]MCW5884919.1 PP2C family protein-serine/threonine phosphatase [Candidatus Kapabacteria bacterium]
MKYIITILLFIIFANLSAQDELGEMRLILFNKVGQKETVKTSENISIIFGSDINTDYTYLSYSSGKNRGEYIIELKSNEPFYKALRQLKDEVDVLKSDSKSHDPKIDTIFLEPPGIPESSRLPQILRVSDIADSLSEELSKREKQDIVAKISKSGFDEYSDSILINANLKTIKNNEAEIDRNKNRIDTLLSAIEESRRSGKGLEKIDMFYDEIDSLRARNIEIEQINDRLKARNSILSADLRAREAEYTALIRLIYFISAIAVIVILVAVFFYISYKQKKKFNIELGKVNVELERINKHLKVANIEQQKLLRIIRKELDTASKYIYSLLPEPLNMDNIKSEWVFIPSSQLGGDSFGYRSIDDNNYSIYIIDVSGHGVGAALHSVQVLNILNNKALPDIDFAKPGEVLTKLNKLFQMSKYNGMYFTIFYGVYNKSTRILNYSSAGHPPMLLFEGVKYSELAAQDIFIGAVPDLEYSSTQVEIKSSSSLVLFSDGAFEVEKSQGEMNTFYDFAFDVQSRIFKNKNSIKSLYDNATKISNKTELDDDFSFIKIDFK